MTHEQGSEVQGVLSPAEHALKERQDTFRRLCGKRVATALEKISLIGNCANRAQYAYTQEQVDKIRAALQTELDHTMNKFADKAKQTGNTFEL
jgi:hypothetical protein